VERQTLPRARHTRPLEQEEPAVEVATGPLTGEQAKRVLERLRVTATLLIPLIATETNND